MRAITLKTLTWTTILFAAVLVTFIANSFVTRRIEQDLNIPPLLETGNEQTQAQDIGCDPLVIAMDGDGNVYSGRDCIGSLTNTSELITSLKEVVEARSSRLAYARGMDLNLEVPPPPCADEPVYIKGVADANDGRTLLLVKLLREVGAHPIGLIKDKKKF